MEFFTKHKKALFITAVILCIVMMMLASAYRTRPTLVEDAIGYFLTPIQGFVTNVSGWTRDRIVFFTTLNYIDQENARLRYENDLLRMENARLRLIEQENIKLSELLELSQKYPHLDTVGAEVIAKNPGNLHSNFIINKGRRDGVYSNMVVIAPGGVVGRIVESGYTYSMVRTIIDDMSSVSAKSARTGDIGIVRGDMRLMAEGLSRMDLINIDADIILGDEIITSNLGEIFPPGLTIGIVQEIHADATGLTKHAIIKPLVNFRRLETVLVINTLFVREME